MVKWSVVAGLSVTLLAGSSWFLGDYLWNTVDSRTVAFFVYLAWMALILGSGAGVAALVVRLLFPASFSRTSASGRRNLDQEVDEFLELKGSTSLFQPVMVYYSVFMVALSVAAMFLAQQLSDAALFSFKMVQQEAMSRSSNPDELLSLFEEIGEMKKPDEVDRFVRKLPQFYDHSEEAVREGAFQATAVMAQRMNFSVRLLVQGGELLDQRWEPDIVDWLRGSVGPRLKQLYDSGVTPRPGIVRAMAWIQAPDCAPFFSSLVSSRATVDAEFTEAVVGLGNLATLEGAESLAAAVGARQGVSRLTLFWALRRIGQSLQPDPADQEQGERILKLLEKVVEQFPHLDDAALCAAVHAVWTYQHAGVTTALTDLFESPRGELVCPRVEIRPPFGPPVALVQEEQLRWLLLNVLADVGVGNPEFKGWVSRMISSGGFEDKTDKGLRQLYGALAGQEE